MNIANDQLQHFTGTSNYYEYLSGNVLTDGTLQLGEQFKCYWFLDIICSYSEHLLTEEFQVWTLEKLPDESAVVECTDGNDNTLVTQKITWTDFSMDKAIVWKQQNVLYLPSEH